MQLQPFVVLRPRLSARLGAAAALGLVLSLFAAAAAAASGGPVKRAPADFFDHPIAAGRLKAQASFVQTAAIAAQPITEHAPRTTDVALFPEPLPTVAPVVSPLDAFVASVADGAPGVLRGVYVPGVLALRVIQQSPSAPFSVDLTPGIATQYTAASAYGVTGLLADNVASGTDFYALAAGQEVTLVYGDGALRRYVVSALHRFQALSPASPYSDFLDLNTGARLSSTALFSQMYSGGDHVTFQTCIAQDGVYTWGRLFVIATPIT
jgi:hypothetical protein